MLDRLSRIRGRIESVLAFLPPLVTRIVVGYGFYLTGHGKLEHLDRLIGQFEEWKIPFAQLQAPMVARLEYFGGMALMAGLLTRPFAIALAGSMVVALLKVDGPELVAAFGTESEKVPTDVTSFAYLVLLLCGAGTLSIDRILRFGWDRFHPKAADPDAKED